MSPTTPTHPLTTRLQHSAAIDTLASTHLLTPNSTLDTAVTNSKDHNLPPITISPLQGQFLAIQAQLIGAKSILEVGTLGGYSTLWFAGTGAKVTSIEVNPKYRDVAVANTRAYGEKVDVILGDAMEVLGRLEAEGRVFDMVFIDADWERQAEYFERAVGLTRQGGCIYVDNVVRELLERIDGGEDLEGEGSTNLVKGVGRLKDRVQATVLQTVSSHKAAEEDRLDGFLLAIVKG